MAVHLDVVQQSFLHPETNIYNTWSETILQTGQKIYGSNNYVGDLGYVTIWAFVGYISHIIL
jgi:hypothetical protein